MHSRRCALALFLASGAVVACAPQAPPAPPPPDVSAVRAAIEASNTKEGEAIMRGDSVAAAAFYDADAVILAPGGPAWHGSAEVRKGFNGWLGAYGVKAFALKVESVQVAGDYAVETGTYQWTMVPKKGKEMPDHGKYVVVWKKQADGSWKLFRDIWNTDIAPTS